jgi:hypothetical protein
MQTNKHIESIIPMRMMEILHLGSLIQTPLAYSSSDTACPFLKRVLMICYVVICISMIWNLSNDGVMVLYLRTVEGALCVERERERKGQGEGGEGQRGTKCT